MLRLRGGSLRLGCHRPQAPLGLPVGPGARACPLPVLGCGSTDAGVRLPGAASPGTQGSHTCPTRLPCCPDSQNQSRLASRPARGEPRATGPFPCPGLPLCPGALANAAAPTPAGPECPDSTLLKPTGDTIVRGCLCVETGLCPGAECSLRALVEGPLLRSPPGAPAGRAEQEEESLCPWCLCFSAGIRPTLTAFSGW